MHGELAIRWDLRAYEQRRLQKLDLSVLRSLCAERGIDARVEPHSVEEAGSASLEVTQGASPEAEMDGLVRKLLRWRAQANEPPPPHAKAVWRTPIRPTF